MSSLRGKVREATEDPILRANLIRATDTTLGHRRDVVEERPDWEALRERAEALREHVLTHLDHYVDRFAEEAQKRGTKVHVALDKDEACRVVREIVEAAGAKQVLKAKSMTTEEIELNASLEAAGITPLETDLGEYIVQLMGQPPSHITAPALHLSAEQILETFREHGVLEGAGDAPTDRDELATWLSLRAREHLRQALLEAPVGITGANFLVAETGTVSLTENEGNIRFTTLSPRIQIAVAGVEKLVPSIEDLATMLPLLTRSATGQRATGYTSLISGPIGDELHVVLLDAGRTELLGDPESREILRCIRCGACLNVCPVYRTIGGHAYGSPYPGPMGSVLTPGLRGGEDDSELPFASSLCGACADVCPVKIDLPGQLLRLRGEAVREGKGGAKDRLGWRLWARAMSGRKRYRLAGALLRRLLRPAAAVGFLRPWTKGREAPVPAKRTFRDLWKERDGAS